MKAWHECADRGRGSATPPNICKICMKGGQKLVMLQESWPKYFLWSLLVVQLVRTPPPPNGKRLGTSLSLNMEYQCPVASYLLSNALLQWCHWPFTWKTNWCWYFSEHAMSISSHRTAFCLNQFNKQIHCEKLEGLNFYTPSPAWDAVLTAVTLLGAKQNHVVVKGLERGCLWPCLHYTN